LSGTTPLPFACRKCETAERNDPIASAGAGDGTIGDASAPELNDHSPREREIADLLSLGHTNSEIGAILHLSIRPVEHHRSRVFHKMNVRSRAELV
jgi:DNA-binding CsgD family transcriptional regulator